MIITQKILSVKRSEWECHTDTPDNVITTINRNFLDILNTTNSPVWAQKRIYDFFTDNDYNKYGFNATEGNQVATDVINKYYNSDINRWAYYWIKLKV